MIANRPRSNAAEIAKSGVRLRLSVKLGVVWVQIEDWLLVDREIELPGPGSVMRSVGVRLEGTPVAAAQALADSVRPVAEADKTLRHGDGGAANAEYVVTGTVDSVHEIEVSGDLGRKLDARPWECRLIAAPWRFIVSFTCNDPPRPDLLRATVLGKVHLIPPYGWESFPLPAVRQDWLARRVIKLSFGAAVDLIPLEGTTDR